MLKVKMLRTTPGSTDGIRVQSYKEGETYELPDSLAKVFVGEKLAEPVMTPVVVPAAVVAPDQKMAGGAPENKALGEAAAGKDAAKADGEGKTAPEGKDAAAQATRGQGGRGR